MARRQCHRAHSVGTAASGSAAMHEAGVEAGSRQAWVPADTLAVKPSVFDITICIACRTQEKAKQEKAAAAKRKSSGGAGRPAKVPGCPALSTEHCAA